MIDGTLARGKNQTLIFINLLIAPCAADEMPGDSRYPGCRKFGHEHPSASSCKCCAVRCRVGVGGDTALVAVVEEGAVRRVNEGRGLRLPRHCAAGERMQPHLAVGDQINAFKSVDFPTCRKV